MTDIEVTITDANPIEVTVVEDTPIEVTVGQSGPRGAGVVAGGTTGQALVKRTNADDDTEWKTIDKDYVGLENVDNTSDLDKPISTATQTALDLKVDENLSIVGATKTKITYDAKGLVTSGADATTDDISEGSTNKYDKIVNLIEGTNVTITGTYPDYTIAASDINLDEKVKYNSADPTAGYVADKFVAGTGISLAEGTGADENKLVVTNSGIITETDPIYSASEAANITETDITNLGNLSGTNTGDQESSDFDIKDLTDSTNLRTTWDSKVGEAPIDTKQYVRSDGDWEEVTIPTGTINRGLNFDIDGVGVVPVVGAVGGGPVSYSGSFTGWKIINTLGVASSIVLTIKKNGTDISGTEKPTLASATSNEDLSLSTWTTSFTKGDVITATIDSVSVGTKYSLTLYAEASN